MHTENTQMSKMVGEPGLSFHGLYAEYGKCPSTDARSVYALIYGSVKALIYYSSAKCPGTNTVYVG